MNLVEMLVASEEDSDCAFDQPCKHGHRVEHHAVYCHNEKWKDAPRKCRRSKYYGEYDKNHEDSDYQCSGYEPNPNYKGPK